jgi:nitrate/TMAO reductase-like tetraheme cytochrome c subunit
MRIVLLLLLSGCSEKPAEDAVGDAGIESGEDQAQDTPETDIPPDTGSEPETDSGEVEPHDIDYRSASWCAECHPTQFGEWEQSMHRYAAHSPVFDQMTAKAVRDTAGATGTFCTGCHTPIGTMEGEPGTTTAADRSDISLEGVTCVVCHQAVAHEQPIGNTSLVLDFDAPMQGPFEGIPNPGHLSVQGDLISTPELCGSCHDVFNFPGLRIEEAYTEYQSSPAAEMGTRCQDCHMSPNPGKSAERPMGPAAVVEGMSFPVRELSSHRFVGPDYSLLDNFPYADDSAANLVAQDEMRAQIQTLLENAVHIIDLSLEEDSGAATLTVMVENKTSGHNVPTGFTSERQMWLHVAVTDGEETVWESGNLDTQSDLRDELSWDVIAGDAALDEQLVNFQSQNLLRVGDVAIATPEVHETMFPFDADYIVRRSLAPFEVRSLQYTLPPISSTARIDVALRYRNLPPYILRALQLDTLVERLQVFTIDEATLEGRK